jgi:hypothetical protein
MSATTKVNLLINQGATFRYKFTWKDAKGRLIDLTGFSARMQIRATVTDVAILVTLTTVSGGIVLGAKAGTVSLFMSDTNTSALAWAKGVYDIELVSPSAEVFRLVGGTVTVSPEVTR